MMVEMNDMSIWITFAFIIGYFFITMEHFTRVDKAAIALLMAVGCWTLQFAATGTSCEGNLHCLGEHIGNISQIIFFILAALTIVEIISAHKGFDVISDRINTRSKHKLLWIVGFITFFLSSVLDNLTTTIVMVTLLQKIIEEPSERLLFGGGIVIAANAGGAWTPIGDVTTTMLWIGGQLSAEGVVLSLFLPSIVCMIASFACLHFMIKGSFQKSSVNLREKVAKPFSKRVLLLGVILLVSVPLFKMASGLPPFMGMLLALGLLWLFTDIVHRGKENLNHLRAPHALSRLDYSGVLFFLGILLAVEALDSAGVLTQLALILDRNIGNTTLIATAIGLASAVVDNVPLVAASMGMYEMTQFAQDSDFWNLIAFCAGTGGSILVIGSAAGVVFMGLEKVNFFWYLRTISLPATVGYFAGIITYLLM